MPSATPGPRPHRPYRRDYVEDDVWIDQCEQHEVCTDDVIVALPDAGPLVPASRRAADAGFASAIVRATWRARSCSGSEPEIRGTLAAVLEFHPGHDQ